MLLCCQFSLKINSPSKVFRDEVSAMTMKGLGEGVLNESRAQAKVIQNAARYLTSEAKAGSITTTGNDDRKNCSSTGTVSFAGSNFHVMTSRTFSPRLLKLPD